MGLLLPPPSPPMSDFTADGSVQSLASISKIQELHGHLHKIRLMTLSDGSEAVVKSSPSQEICLLRIEQSYLDSEIAVLGLLANANLPVPRILHHKVQSATPRSLLMTRLPGTYLVDVQASLTKAQRSSIDKQMRTMQARLAQHTSSTFGPAGLVKAGQGCKMWRDAFLGMVESILMDGEDIMSNLPYHQIREAIAKWESYLEDVTEARLVLPSLCRGKNILVDPQTNLVTGVLDFGDAIWGDAMMTGEGDPHDIKRLL